MREYRRVAFSADEVAAALPFVDEAMRTPIDELSSCTIRIADRNGRQAVEVEVGGLGGAPVRSVSLEATEMVEALVRFCIDHRINLPRDAEKRLIIVDGEIGFDFVLETDREPPRGR